MQGNAPNPSLPFGLHLVNVEIELSVMAKKSQHGCRHLRFDKQVPQPHPVATTAFKD